uniref:Selenoprotein F n=1 Tax=Cebus imitator TaxID=2715852 RepID=A0A2K5RRS7_CEBIM
VIAMAAGPGGWLLPAFQLRLLFATVLQVSAFGAEFSSEACRELGFSSNLLCSSCDLLGQFNLLQLDPDCRGCCQEEAQFETKKQKYHHSNCMQELFLRFVDENWEGSLKSKLLLGVTNPNCSEDYKSR